MRERTHPDSGLQISQVRRLEVKLKCSVIVCTFRRNRVLRETLKHLLEETFPRYELIVVDQQANHDAETTDWLAAAADSRKIIYFNLPNPGLTAARNFGAAQARGTVLLYCDDDIVPAKGLIESHLSNYSDLSVAAVAGQVLHPGETPGHAPGTFRHDKRLASFTQLYGANFSIRKSALIAIGGADEKLGVHAYTEDVLMARSLCARNLRIIYDPSASVLHLKDPTGGCRITDLSQPTSEAERSHSKLYLYHRLRLSGAPEKWKALWDGIRHGPLRRQNVVHPWRQPWAWYSFLKSYRLAGLHAEESHNDNG